MENKIPLKVWNAIGDIGQSVVIAQELPPIRQIFKYCVLAFEIHRNIVLNSPENGIGASDLEEIFCEGANSIEEVYSLLKKQGIRPDLFVPAWRCEFPL
jgi:hypothetical protein